MNRLKFVLFSLLISFDAVGVAAQETKYPPFREYLSLRIRTLERSAIGTRI